MKNVLHECKFVCANSHRFRNACERFICDGYEQVQFFDTDYVSAGFFESCVCLHCLLLEELTSFVRPSVFTKLIVSEMDDT